MLTCKTSRKKHKSLLACLTVEEHGLVMALPPFFQTGYGGEYSSTWQRSSKDCLGLTMIAEASSRCVSFLSASETERNARLKPVKSSIRISRFQVNETQTLKQESASKSLQPIRAVILIP